MNLYFNNLGLQSEVILMAGINTLYFPDFVILHRLI